MVVKFLVVVSLASSACNNNRDADKDSATKDTLASDSSGSRTATASREQQFCAALKWPQQCKIHEYYDDQRLSVSHGSYGPLATVYPSPGLKDRTNFALGQAVAAVFVDTVADTPLPQTYQRLHLRAGPNCIYLEPAGQSFNAYVTPGSMTVGCPSLQSATGLTAIPVNARSTPGFEQSDDVPPVARFLEGRRQQDTLDAQPMIGFKCGNRWCAVMPTGFVRRRNPHQGMNANMKKWVVPGWGDVQYLALPRPGGTLGRSTMIASLIPAQATDFDTEEEFDNGPHLAATVIFESDPAGTKYASSYGFQQGENQLWIFRDANGYSAEVRQIRQGCPNGTGCKKSVRVERVDHNFQPPASARWRWLPADEGIWVRCADGCCKVSGN